jgi:hypothetical protein
MRKSTKKWHSRAGVYLDVLRHSKGGAARAESYRRRFRRQDKLAAAIKQLEGKINDRRLYQPVPGLHAANRATTMHPAVFCDAAVPAAAHAGGDAAQPAILLAAAPAD